MNPGQLQLQKLQMILTGFILKGKSQFALKYRQLSLVICVVIRDYFEDQYIIKRSFEFETNMQHVKYVDNKGKFLCFFSVRLLSVLRGHSFFSSQP